MTTPTTVRGRAAEPTARAPHVAFVGHSSALSGAEISLLRLIEHLPDTEATVLLAESGPLVSRLRTLGVPTHVVPLPESASQVTRGMVTPGRLPVGALVASVVYTARLTGILVRRRPDIVHTNSMKAHLYGGLAAAIARVPHVWHARDRAAPDYLPATTVRLVRLAARLLATTLVANSRSTLETYPGVRDGIVVYNGVPAHAPRPRPPHDALRVGVVGRLAPWKGQHVFLRAFASAFAGGRERAVVVGGSLFGEDDYADGLRDLARQLAIEDQVEFVGHSDDVPGLLDSLDVLVHCSTIPEPFGQVVVEGMGAGLAVVAAAAGGPAEIVEDGRTGLLVDPGDHEGLAAALRRLADDPEERGQLGIAARGAARRFEPHRCATEVAAVHRRLLADPARRGRLVRALRGRRRPGGRWTVR